MPKNWDSATGHRPIVFLHGLGLGLFQYHKTIVHLFDTFRDRPVLVLIQPQISQNIFHPRYLQPMTRHQMADRLARLLQCLDWVDPPGDDPCSSSDETEMRPPFTGNRRQGVTMLSHSKYALVFSHPLSLYSAFPKRIVYPCLDAQEPFQDDWTFLLHRSSYLLFLGRG